MKYFMLLCVLVVVGVRARPSALDPKAGGGDDKVSSGLSDHVEIQDYSLDDLTGIFKDISGSFTDVLKKVGPAAATALALVPIVPLGGKRDIPVEKQDVDWDAVLGDIVPIAGDVTTNAVTVLPSVIGLLGKGKRGLDNTEDLEKLHNLLNVEFQDWNSKDTQALVEGIVKAPLVNSVGGAVSTLYSIFHNLGKRDALEPITVHELEKIVDDLKNKQIDSQDFDLEDITGALAKISTAWSGIVTNKLGPALSKLPLGSLGKLGKRDLPVELQDTDWDAVLGHIVGIAGDITTNAATVLPSILGALGGLGKREIGNDLDVQDFDLGGILKLVKSFVPILNIIPDVGKRGVETEDFDLEDITGALAKISSAWSGIVTNKLGPALNGLPLGALGKLGKRDIPAELQDTDWDAVLGHIVGIAGDITTNAATVLPSILGALGGLGKRELRDDLDVQDFDLEDITGALAKISSAWSGIVTNKLGPALSKLPLGSLGKLGKRDLPVELQDTDWDAVLGHIVGIAGDITTNAATVLPSILGALGGLGKRELGDDLDVQDFDLEDITGALAKISSAWSGIVTNKLGPALNGLPLGALGKLGKRDFPAELQDTDWDAVLGHIVGIAGDITTNAATVLPSILGALGGLGKREIGDDLDVQDFDLEDITGALAKISSAWSGIVTNKLGPALSKLPLGSLGKLGKREIETEDFDLDDITGFFSKIGDLVSEQVNTKIAPAVAKMPPGTMEKLGTVAKKLYNHESLTSQ